MLMYIIIHCPPRSNMHTCTILGLHSSRWLQGYPNEPSLIHLGPVYLVLSLPFIVCEVE